MVEQLSQSIWRVGGGQWDGSTEAVTSDGCNSYLVTLDKATLLIDCGYVRCKREIEHNISDAGIEPAAVTDLVLTHSHWDHSEAASAWKTDYGLHIHANAMAAEYLEQGDLRLTGVPKQGPEFHFPVYQVDDPLTDDQTLDIGGAKFTSRNVPGHTPDSTLFTAEIDGKRVGFCGDVTFGPNAAGKLGTIGWLAMLWQSSLRDYKSSLERMVAMDFDLLLPGHGRALTNSTDAAEAISASLRTVEHLRADPWISSFGTVAD